MSNESRDSPPERPGVPPWLWFWVGIFLISLSDTMQVWQQSFDELIALQESAQRLQDSAPVYASLYFLLYPAALLHALPSIALFAGLLTALAPWLRARFLERRFRLMDPPANIVAITEICDFVGRHAPGLAVKTNVLRGSQLAFIYPSGFGKATIALFGGLLRMWRADRKAAEAVLLHEIAHYRRGDVLILGVGSFFEAVVKYMMLYFLILVALPVGVMFVVGMLAAGAELRAIGMPLELIWVHQFTQITTFGLPGVFVMFLSFLFGFATFLILPAMGIWCAELNADRVVVQQQQSTQGIARGLESFAGRISWWRWLLFRLSHPPARMRQWMARDNWLTLSLLLLLFPAAYFMRLLLLHGRAVVTYVGMDLPTDLIWEYSLANTRVFVTILLPIWLALTAMLLAWPVLARYWMRFFAKQDQALNLSEYPIYLFCALLVGLIAGLSFLLRT